MSGANRHISPGVVYVSDMDLTLRGELIEEVNIIARLRISFRQRRAVDMGIVSYLLEGERYT